MPSYIGKPIYISRGKGISCGRRVRIYPGLRAELVNKDSYISIGDNASIGQNFHVVSYNDNLIIGNDVTIAGNVFITNCDHDYRGKGKSVLENELIGKHTEIGDGCFLGNNSVILAGTILGKGCVVGANSVLRGIYPENSVIAGAPAKVLKCY
jgi:acetyltransferase-like isoleucine patch superfamily enzyme